jgi:hypothetical protein
MYSVKLRLVRHNQVRLAETMPVERISSAKMAKPSRPIAAIKPVTGKRSLGEACPCPGMYVDDPRPRQACPSARQKKAPGYVFISAKAGPVDRGLHKPGGARRVRDNMRE